MKRPRIVVTHRIHNEIAQLLSREGDLVANSADEPWPEAQLREYAAEAEALMVFMPDRIDDGFLAACPRLKVIAGALKGYDNFDVAACERRGILFTIVPDLLSEPTAELALALMLTLTRHVITGDRQIRSGQFQGWRPTLYGRSVYDATVGIIGYGAVGQALARLLEAFRCRILKFGVGDSNGTLKRLLNESDFVLPLLPLTAETHHFLNAERLRELKTGCLLVNVGRGSLVDERAAAEALAAGRLGGYAADTFEMEDWARSDRPIAIDAALLAQVDRTVFTPHLGSAVAQARLEIERTAALSLLQGLQGEVPENVVPLR